jgi:hypothetical protein
VEVQVIFLIMLELEAEGVAAIAFARQSKLPLLQILSTGSGSYHELKEDYCCNIN